MDIDRQDRQKPQSHMVLALCPVEIGISIVVLHTSKQKLSMGYCQLMKYFTTYEYLWGSHTVPSEAQKMSVAPTHQKAVSWMSTV